MSRLRNAVAVVLPLFVVSAVAAVCGLMNVGSAEAAEGLKRVDAGAAGLPLLFFDDFESGKADQWAPGDANAWAVYTVGGSKVYSQFRASQVKNPVRSPFNRSLIKDVTVGSFALDVRLQSTIKDYPHRDLCLFFGYQDPAHLYYVHLGKKMDAHANNIFIVNNKPRLKISKTTTAGTDWDDKWHHARVVRDVDSGTISVYFDDMTKPVMTAVDTTFSWGQVGLGSFDDTGNFDEVYLFGDAVKPGTVGGVSGGEIEVIDNRPVGEWNTFRIKMVGEKVWVWLNGVSVADNVTLENYWDRNQPIFSTGQIELQNHGNTLYFKNVFLREISRD